MHLRLRTAVAGALTLLASLTCTPAPPPEVVPTPAPPSTAQPEIRIGVLIGAPTVDLHADSELSLAGEDGAARTLDRESAWTLGLSGGKLALTSASGRRTVVDGSVNISAPAGTPLWVGARQYRGTLTVFRDRTGLTVVNRVGMEDYLAGVVSAEMGKRDPADREALAAQAVISRTYALKNLGKRKTEGFDLYPTVVDQVYGGMTAETPLGWEAVRETAGRVITYGGAPIDAFFFSTCGGHTADGTEVFAGANRPYLRGVSDEDPSGEAYCRISPRYRWREEWTGDQLRTMFQRGLPGTSFREVRSVRVVERTGSDRVARLMIGVDNSNVPVIGPAVRQVLHPIGEPLLRSSAFTLTETHEGRALSYLVADGRGAGHGVGFCQWGAVGRSRAGQGFEQILAAYFPGTSLERLY